MIIGHHYMCLKLATIVDINRRIMKLDSEKAYTKFTDQNTPKNSLNKDFFVKVSKNECLSF